MTYTKNPARYIYNCLKMYNRELDHYSNATSYKDKKKLNDMKIEFDWRWEWSFKKIVLLVILLFNILVLCGVFDKRDNRNNKSNQGNGGIPSHCEITEDVPDKIY